MNLSEIFKESFSFPVQNWKKLIIIGILLFIPGIFQGVYTMYNNVIVAAVAAILSIIFGIIVQGYVLSVVGNTIKGFDLIPEIILKNNFIDGLKVLVVEIVYGICLAIIFAIILALTGGLDLLPALSSATPGAAASAIPNPTPLLVVGLVIVAIVAIIAMFFILVSNCRLAKTGSIKAALSWSGITEDIKSIGVGKIIGWYIILAIIVFVISFIVGLIASLFALIPVVGVIIYTFIVCLLLSPYLALFSARAMGLLYTNA